MIRRTFLAAIAACTLLGLGACGDDRGSEGTALAARRAPGTDGPAAPDADVFDIAVGDCFDLGDAVAPEADDDTAEAIDDVAIVACDGPHDNEVFHAFELPVDGGFPGADALAEQADEGCLAPFDDFVAEPERATTLAIYLLYPTEESWARGDREVVCSVFQPDGGKLTGSVGRPPG